MIRFLCDNLRQIEFKNIQVPPGSPSRGGDGAVYVFNINQPSLPTPLKKIQILFLCLFLSVWPFQLYFIP